MDGNGSANAPIPPSKQTDARSVSSSNLASITVGYGAPAAMSHKSAQTIEHTRSHRYGEPILTQSFLLIYITIFNRPSHLRYCKNKISRLPARAYHNPHQTKFDMCYLSH